VLTNVASGKHFDNGWEAAEDFKDIQGHNIKLTKCTLIADEIVFLVRVWKFPGSLLSP
jgi:hypothetical protein